TIQVVSHFGQTRTSKSIRSRHMRPFLQLALWVLGAAMIVPPSAAWPGVNYDIVYVRQIRLGPADITIWPDVFHPAQLDPGADLMLLHTNGTQEVLVAGGNGGVTDPCLSFDAQWCYYAYYPDLRDSAVNFDRNALPYAGADIYRINLTTRQIV